MKPVWAQERPGWGSRDWSWGRPGPGGPVWWTQQAEGNQTQGERHVKVKTEIRVMLLPAQAPQRWPATGQQRWGAGHLDQILPRPHLGLRLPASRLRENDGLQSTPRPPVGATRLRLPQETRVRLRASQYRVVLASPKGPGHSTSRSPLWCPDWVLGRGCRRPYGDTGRPEAETTEASMEVAENFDNQCGRARAHPAQSARPREEKDSGVPGRCVCQAEAWTCPRASVLGSWLRFPEMTLRDGCPGQRSREVDSWE